jgi:hypothetical protein
MRKNEVAMDGAGSVKDACGVVPRGVEWPMKFVKRLVGGPFSVAKYHDRVVVFGRLQVPGNADDPLSEILAEVSREVSVDGAQPTGQGSALIACLLNREWAAWCRENGEAEK